MTFGMRDFPTKNMKLDNFCTIGKDSSNNIGSKRRERTVWTLREIMSLKLGVAMVKRMCTLILVWSGDVDENPKTPSFLFSPVKMCD